MCRLRGSEHSNLQYIASHVAAEIRVKIGKKKGIHMLAHVPATSRLADLRQTTTAITATRIYRCLVSRLEWLNGSRKKKEGMGKERKVVKGCAASALLTHFGAAASASSGIPAIISARPVLHTKDPSSPASIPNVPPVAFSMHV